MDVIGIGALNFDRLYMVEKIARAGEEERAHSVVEAPGGSAANTVAGLSRLGARTGFIGTAGRDREGEFILSELKKEHVDITGIKRAKGPTGTVIGFVDRKGERALYAYPGVNDSLEINKKQAKYARSAKYIHLSSFVGSGPLKAQKNLIKELKATHVTFAPGMLYANKFSKIKPIIKKSSVLFLNKEETELMTGNTYQKGAQELSEIGAGIVAVTLGKKGCFAACENGTYTVKGYKSRAIDTTGAGDAFAAGFLYGLLEGRSIELCAKLGNWTASRCIAKAGARDGLPYRKDLKKQGIIKSSLTLK
jgi:ribokinase